MVFFWVFCFFEGVKISLGSFQVLVFLGVLRFFCVMVRGSWSLLLVFKTPYVFWRCFSQFFKKILYFCVCFFVCVCVCIFVFVFVFLCLYLYFCVCVCIFVFVFVVVFFSLYFCVCSCIFVFVYLCIHLCWRICMVVWGYGALVCGGFLWLEGVHCANVGL